METDTILNCREHTSRRLLPLDCKFRDEKQRFYDEVLSGKKEYVSNLRPAGEP